MKNALGVALLSAGYWGAAWLITQAFDVGMERALTIVAFVVLAQLRWYQREVPPVHKDNEQ